MKVVRERLSPVAGVWLTAVWVMLWGNLSWFNVVSGALVALVVMLLFPLPRLQIPVRFRPGPAVVLALRFLSDLVVASAQVAWIALRPGPIGGGSIVAVRLRSREDLFQTLVAEMTGLVPGTVVLDLDHASDTLTLHCLEVTTREQQDAVRRRVLLQEERVLRALDRYAERTLAGAPERAGSGTAGGGP